MSRYVGNHDACPECGLLYRDLRTGLTYRDVYHFVWSRPHKRRGTVLGAWFEIKQGVWREHLDTCEGVPF